MYYNEKQNYKPNNKETGSFPCQWISSLPNSVASFLLHRRQITSSEAEDGHIVIDSEKYIYISGNYNDYKYFCNRVFYSFSRFKMETKKNKKRKEKM